MVYSLQKKNFSWTLFFGACISILIGLSPINSFATHSMGSDMSYECLGNNTYKIKVSFYRDCSGIPAPFNIRIDIHSTNCNIDTFARLWPIPGTGQDITPLCPSDTSTCHGGSFTGIQEWVYEGTFTFPAQCTDWNLSYNLCCRNAAITNINNPLQDQIYIFSTLNNTVTPCNNSPVFSNKPVPFICLGQQFCYNHGAYDPDGDSLAYSVMTPLSSQGNPVQYNAPYSAYQPLNSVPAMTLDYITGDFCLTPQSIEVTVMAILVSEYRNGVLIGTIERDIQITVIPCTNILPGLTGINGTNSYSATICADDPFCFDIFSNDPDTGQTVIVTWDQAIPPATLNTNINPRPTGTFCWTPTQADASGVPHCFTATVTDDACPFLGSQTFAYCLTVVNVAVNAGPDQSVNCGALATITAAATTSSGNVTYLWSNGCTTQSQNVGPGTYSVTVANGQCTATDAVQINPISGPTAVYNAPSVCFPNSVNFSDQSITTSGTINSWNWNFGDGTTSTQQSPTHLYAAAGVYNVCLTVNTTANCTSSICQNVTVNPSPVPTFNVTNSCLGSATNPVNTSTLGSNVFNWNFGNGTSSNQTSPSLTYANAGTYNITLIATDALGCADTIVQPVIIYPLPNTGFTFTTNPCVNSQVSFTDTTSGTTSWNWNFGNGQTSTLQNPSISYNPGNYNVTLNVTTANGCTGNAALPVNIIPAFVANAIQPQGMCNGATASITATGGTTYLWDNGQTTASISVTPSQSTNYIVTVTNANGCSDTVLASVNVFQLPNVSAGADTNICSGINATLAASGAFTYTWSNGINNSVNIVSPVTNTTYTVIGTDANGCTGSDDVAVAVNPPLVVNPGDPFICPGSNAILDAGYPGAAYTWSNGQTTQTISVSNAGNYAVMVTQQNGCTGAGQSNVTVGTPLVDNTSIESTCTGQNVSLDAGNPGCSYNWSNGSTTQAINVSSSGSYNVVVTGIDGCTISFACGVILNPNPIAAFNAVDICEYDQAVFLNNSTVAAGNIINYHWDFGDGATSLIQSPNHFYSNSGTYPVRLIILSDSGCVDTANIQIAVHPAPVAALQGTDVCLGDTTDFTEASVVLNDTLSFWGWSFGDGALASGKDQSHRYALDGNYNVQLITNTIHGCSDTTSINVLVHPIPAAEAGPDHTICSGNQVTIGDVPQAGLIYQWSPVTGLVQPSSSSTIVQLQNSTFSVVDNVYYLSTTNQFGCTNNDSMHVFVKPVPQISFRAPGPQCLTGNMFTFVPSGYIDNNSSLIWNFGLNASPAVSSNTNPPLVSYSTPGDHIISITYSYAGCPGVPMTDTITVLDTPPTAFTPSSYEGCMPLTVTFHNSNYDPANQYTWTVMGDTIIDNDPVYTFTQPGSFQVTLFVSNINGCSATPYTIPINIYDVPDAGFTNTPEHTFINESLIEFDNTSAGASFYNWDFGDGSTDYFFNGSHVYQDTGTFDITLIAISQNGCRDTIHGQVVIEEGFSFYVPNAFTPNDDGSNDTFQGYGTYLYSYEMSIYDRWGKVIYYTDDYDRPWDGRINTMCQNDTYVYRINVKDYRQKSHVFIGSVTLVK